MIADNLAGSEVTWLIGCELSTALRNEIARRQRILKYWCLETTGGSTHHVMDFGLVIVVHLQGRGQRNWLEKTGTATIGLDQLT